METTSHADMLGIDELSQVLSFLNWKELLIARVCREWRDAVKVTLVPQSMSRTISWIDNPDYFIKNREYALQLPWLVEALPRLQTVNSGFHYKGTSTFMVKKGDNPIESYVYYPENQEPPTIDLRILTKFRDLRSLTLEGLSFNGSYDFLFTFQNLEILNISHTGHLRWDLSMVANLPKLKKLKAMKNNQLTGNLDSLKAVQSTLEELALNNSQLVEGTLMSLAKFPHLKRLNLSQTKITGDIRDIGDTDFVALRGVDLPGTVYGGEIIHRIQDAPEIMQTWYRLKQRNTGLFGYSRWTLTIDSPQRYYWDGHYSRDPPFNVEFVRAGPRMGWRWTNCFALGSCETNWLEPEPDTSHPKYEDYLTHLERQEKEVFYYKGYHVPPTQLQHEDINDNIPPPLIPVDQSPTYSFWHFNMPDLEPITQIME